MPLVRPLVPLGVAALLLAVPTPDAAAHVALDVREATAGSSVRLALRVPHGCAGAATTSLRVRLPDELRNAKPQPKAGWTVDLVLRDAAGHGHGHGHHDGDEPAEIAWSGGSLADAHYDEFVLVASIDRDAAGTLHLPVVQECEGGLVERWITIPAGGQSAGGVSHPAPSLRIVPRS